MSIPKQLSEMRERIDKLDDALIRNERLLKEKRAEQVRIIVAGHDAAKINAEIAELVANAEGLRRAIDELANAIKQLRAEQAQDAQALAVTQAEKALAEKNDLMRALYYELTEHVHQLNAIRAKQAEISAARQQMSERDRKVRAEFHSDFFDRNFQGAFMTLLETFPAGARNDKSLPSLDDVRRAMSQQ
jgi:phage shock protein A